MSRSAPAIASEAAEPARWEIATRAIPHRLRPYIRDYTGYVERTARPLSRRELPSTQVAVIFEFGPPIRVFQAGSSSVSQGYSGGFVAGLDDTFTLTEHDGYQTGLQLNLTPLGARSFFERPLSELAGCVLPLSDALPREHRSLTARLEALKCWDERFDLLEAIIGAAVAPARFDRDPVAWAYARILESGGTMDVGRLARELGYSQKHVIALFKDRVGLPPKRVARIVRFDALMQRLRRGTTASWAELAADLGFADQSHLVREVRSFTGLTPTGTRAVLDGWWPVGE